MDAIVLAGGLGTRLRETVPGVPKPLAPVSGRPFLDLLLQQLGKWSAIQKVVLAVGHQADQIIERYSEHAAFGHFEIAFSREIAPLGTGGAIKLALAHINSQDVLVLNGDSFLAIDWEAFWNAHRAHGGIATLAVVPQPDVSRFGSVNVHGGRVTSFVEKGGAATPGLINGGIYLFKQQLKAWLPDQDHFSIEKDVFPKLLAAGVYAFETSGKFIDIGTKDSYAIAQHLLKE